MSLIGINNKAKEIKLNEAIKTPKFKKKNLL